ncbi:T9SS type A sorting domain-containing protein [Fulvivirga sp. M361]|nr:T9SS type A sorting domain-containing protein [Fulvivirga sp. M361]
MSYRLENDTLQISVSDLGAGVYFVRKINEEKVVSKRLVRQ